MNTPRAARIGAPFLRNQAFTTFTDNERIVLDLVRRHGSMTRPELANEMGLVLQSIVRLVDGLAARGFLTFGDKILTGAPGQPSRPVQLAPDAAYTFGVSLLRDALAIVLTDLSGQTRANLFMPVDGGDRDAVFSLLRSNMAKIVKRANIDSTRIFGVGIATTGYFVGRAEINTPTSMDGWALRNLEDDFGEALQLPVWIENDGNAAAVGESLYGVGRRFGNFAYIYVSAGLGGGVIVDGKLVRGLFGNAGEFTGLLSLEARRDRPTLTLLREMLEEDGVHFDDLDAMIRNFRPDWSTLGRWLERTRAPYQQIVSAIAAILDPEAIVIGGRIPQELARSLAANARFFMSPTREQERPMPPVLVAEAKGDAAAQGAASLPFKAHFFR